jgi:IMP dehydrogenase
MQRTLCFDDVLLVPQYSDIETRTKVNLAVSGFEEKFASLLPELPVLGCPIIGSPMDTVMSPEAAIVLSEMGGFGIFHRYCTIEEAKKAYLKFLELAAESLEPLHNVMVAIGATGDYLERAQALYDVGCRAFCIDVAHGHHASVKTALAEMRLKFGDSVHIMTGNVATIEAFNDLADWGSNSIRVGVGGGSMCSTRIRTGHGIPTLQSVMDCAKSVKDVFIVADGGIRNSGDAVKALAAGADMVMLGSILAGHDECPGEFIDDKGLTYRTAESAIGSRLFKRFRGMASREAQLQWRGRVSVIEGESTMIPYKGRMLDTIADLLEGIRSGLSYSGARTIRELRGKARFVTVTPQGVQENVPHGKR